MVVLLLFAVHAWFLPENDDVPIRLLAQAYRDVSITNSVAVL